MRQSHSVLAALLLAGSLLLVGAPARTALAQDGDNPPPKPVPAEPKKKTPLELELEAVAKDFAGESVSALLARVPKPVGEQPGPRLRLKLGNKEEMLSRTQAKRVLEQWFEQTKDHRLGKTKSVSPKVLEGRFVLTYRAKAKDEIIRKDLVVRLRKKTRDGKPVDGYELAALELQ